MHTFHSIILCLKFKCSSHLNLCHQSVHTKTAMCDYNSKRLYKDAFNISYNWKKWLPPDVCKYHNLVCKEVNAPVELQMGILLLFISSVCGPLTKGHFLTRPSCLNLFWFSIAASGVNHKSKRE